MDEAANRKLFLRIFVEVRDITETQDVAAAVIATTRECGEVLQLGLQRYWKISEYFEIFMVLQPTKEEGALEKTLLVLGTGWQHGGPQNDPWAVWNPSAGATFFHPAVRWAHLEQNAETLGSEPRF